jgi:hypothetical protein
VPDRPVSRVPDGHDPELLLLALAAPRVEVPQNRAGLRNLQRPFADSIFAQLPGTGSCLVSHPTLRQSFPGARLGSDVTYLMLHGQHQDASLFQGETEDEAFVEAFGVDNVGPTPGAVVFTGCCWGALTVGSRAREYDQRAATAVRSSRDSIALAYLRSGANAFVGCTGAHYSPRFPPYNYGSGPLHQAFFDALLRKRLAPAEALLDAKKVFLEGMLRYQNPTDPGGPGAGVGAVERKLFAQFTCLGLGW